MTIFLIIHHITKMNFQKKKMMPPPLLHQTNSSLTYKTCYVQILFARLEQKIHQTVTNELFFFSPKFISFHPFYYKNVFSNIIKTNHKINTRYFIIILLLVIEMYPMSMSISNCPTHLTICFDLNHKWSIILY